MNRKDILPVIVQKGPRRLDSFSIERSGASQLYSDLMLTQGEIQMNNNERYIAIEDGTGSPYFCPLTAAGGIAEAHRAIAEDICVEADVAGRYAGQITVERH